MASRRVPLSNVPNVVNSPLRPTAKRGRAQSNAAEDALNIQAPPLKKQIFELDPNVPRTPTRRAPAKGVQAGVAEAKVQAIKDKHILARAVRQEKAEAEGQSLEQVRLWQKHYRKVFPSFVFYFEGVSDETRRQYSKALANLGAREEKFFSKEITHVITLRQVPSGNDPSTDVGPSSTAASNQDTAQPRTINPSLLEKTAEGPSGNPKSKFTFEVASSKRNPVAAQEFDLAKPPQPRVDILQRAKDLGIKIWHLEKLDRILRTILEERQPSHGHNTRSNILTAATNVRAAKLNDLSQMIKNEQLHERGDREVNFGSADLVPLKGPFIYIRDMNEKTKPVMLREYTKVQRKEDGDWPQFRSASLGKCPFVEEDADSKRYAERERQREKERAALAKTEAQQQAARRRLAVDKEEMRPPASREPLAESRSAGNSGGPPVAQKLPPPLSKCAVSNAKVALMSGRAGFIRGEPMASGMQQSNITSAIRSQMISSTAPAPGAKAGTSKEIHGLQRKVLERNSGPLGLVPSQRMTDIAGTAARMAGNNPRAAKAKAQEKLGCKPTLDPPAEEETEEAVQEPRRVIVREERKEPKPGYCENCREKFDDFDTHTLSRKHKKFATDKENWRELDDLLSQLVRPLRSASE